MDVSYFNHAPQVAEHRGGRRSFVARWWRICADDPRWVPPYYPGLRRAIEPKRNDHIARMASLFLYVEALSRRRTPEKSDPGSLWSVSPTASLEKPVATAAVLLDPRREDRAAYLTLFSCVNDPSSLRHLLNYLAEMLRHRGCRQLIGPTGLSPHLGTGLLQDCWDEVPPLHSPSNPPYLPEVVGGVMRTLGHSRLYRLMVPQERSTAPGGPAQLSTFDPARLATDLLPLLAAACPPWAGFASPDADEATFLLRWLGRWPLIGWLASIGDEPAGFVLLQPDLAPLLRLTMGARRWPWRLWLAWASRRPVRRGRLLFGAVLPRWRGKGIGRQLLFQALLTAHEGGWETLNIGPLPEGTAACDFLERRGARPRQTFLLYRRDV